MTNIGYGMFGDKKGAISHNGIIILTAKDESNYISFSTIHTSFEKVSEIEVERVPKRVN